MISAVCQHENRRTNGKTKAGATRYRCKSCGASWTESTGKLNGMRIGLDQAAKIIEMLCEGVNVRATARMRSRPRRIRNRILTILQKMNRMTQNKESQPVA